MSAPDNIVPVPKPSGSAYNPDRPLAKNQLLLAHVEHLKHVEQDLPPEKQTGIDIGSITTEGEAAAYIRKMTAILHPEGATKKKRAKKAKVKKAT